ncbi:MAG: Holliday junction branch migration protein RuvA [Pseudomonadota bacterium]
MIGALTGTVAAIEEETAILDVAGVGYEVHAAPRLLQRLVVGEPASLAIETVVREDMIRLYGFESPAERRVFRLLQTVQGVGARHALSVMHVLPADDLSDAVAAGDATAVARAHGVGKKIAQRIVAELAGKMGAVHAGEAGGAFAAQARERAAPAGGEAGAKADAVSALVNLGYDGVDARRAVGRAAQAAGDGAEAGALIKAALRDLAPAR